MRRILLTIAYDGTNYSGFQAQKDNSVPTIAGTLAHALSSLTGEEIQMIGGSRTDAGVHALCNMAAFDTDSRIPAEKFAYAVNVRLPEDIRVQCSQEVPEDFHPLHCSSLKTYEYRIYAAQQPDPVRRLYSCHTSFLLDAGRMQAAARYLVGEHDFKSFCSIYTQAKTTVRTITDITVEEVAARGFDPCRRIQPDRDRIPAREITIRVTGTGFLYNMVRIIAGTLMDVGRGRTAPEDIPSILQAQDRQKAGPTAPACGLTLVGYRFPDLE